MTDAGIATIVTGMVTIVTMVTGFLTLWIKLRYNTGKAEEAVVKAQAIAKKIDYNTEITSTAATAATRAGEHAQECDEERKKLLTSLVAHDNRISVLEGKVEIIRADLDVISKNVDSTRHEMRGHMQSILNGMQVLSAGVGRPMPATLMPSPVSAGGAHDDEAK